MNSDAGPCAHTSFLASHASIFLLPCYFLRAISDPSCSFRKSLWVIERANFLFLFNSQSRLGQQEALGLSVHFFQLLRVIL